MSSLIENEYKARSLKVNEEIREQIAQLTKIAEAHSCFVDEEEEVEQIGKIQSAIDGISSYLGKRMIEIGKKISPLSEEERSLEQALDDIDLELKEEDIKPVAIAKYASNTAVLPTANSPLSKAEIAVLTSEMLDNDVATSQMALTNNAVLACLIEKNMKKINVAHNFIQLSEIDITGTLAAKIILKYGEHKNQQLENMEVVNDVLGIQSGDYSRIKKYLEKFSMGHHFNEYQENYNKLDSSGFVELTKDLSLSRHEAFEQFANRWLKLGIADPNGELQQELENISVKIFCEEKSKMKGLGLS